MSITVPDELSTLTDEDLATLADDIRTAAEALSADAVTDDAALAAVEALAADFDRVTEEVAAREARSIERSERAAAAAARFAGDEVAPEAAVEVEAEAAATDAPVEAAAEAVEAPAETVELAVEAPVEAAVEAAEAPAETVETAVEAPAEAATEAVEAPAEAATLAVEVPVEAAVVEAPVVEAEVVEASAEAVVETVEAPAELATADEAPVEAPVAEAVIDPQAVATAATDTVTSEDAVSDTLSTSTDVAALDAALPNALATRTEAAPVSGIQATNAVQGVNEGAELSTSDLAKAIVNKRTGFGRISAGTSERITLGTAAVDLAHSVGGSEEANFATFDLVRSEWAASRKQETALVASGGVCAPLEPNYDFFRLAEELNPTEGSLPVVAAPRGGIRFITPPDWRDAAGGVRVTTEAEDADGYTSNGGTTDPKPCVSVTCPPVEECRVDAVSQCVTFGNLNYRVFPEQVESFLKDLAVIFTQTKEVFYLDAIDAASTAVTFTPSYSATRGITYTLLAAAANYRRRHHMSADAVLTLHLPSWVIEFLKADLIADHAMGLGFIGAGAAEVNQVFASMALDVSFYYESATGAGQAFAGTQAAGELNPFPASVVAYMYAPGTFVRLNAGTLDLGVVRDSVLNSTNDLQIFSEEWIQVCMVGLESLRLEITLCPDGTGPEPVVPMDCVALSA